MMNDDLRLKMEEVERRLGGPLAAATAAGVRYPTWYRWRVGAIRPSHRTIALVNLLLQGTSNAKERHHQELQDR
jgi:hypothetical protein